MWHISENKASVEKTLKEGGKGDNEEDEDEEGGEGDDDDEEEEEKGDKDEEEDRVDMNDNNSGDNDKTRSEDKDGDDNNTGSEADKNELCISVLNAYIFSKAAFLSTPLSNKNKDIEYKDVEDGKNGSESDKGVQFETANKRRYDNLSLHFFHLSMLPVEENMLLLTQGEDPEKESEMAKQDIDDILDNFSESAFVKLEKGCYKMAPAELKQKVATGNHNL
ncbi:nuclear polyadenylated RNA-binding protein 3-like [Papaver somniferum]|uniref:nuclear polyadenylated RNA-binding protein 3-like n=1 Tax=Papaver somniferum TaxID=3469 RepID=UPI000E6FABC9|nr:nuclear polyadenylated RNA-binding protein 3-like [Papaver somniferum]